MPLHIKIMHRIKEFTRNICTLCWYVQCFWHNCALKRHNDCLIITCPTSGGGHMMQKSSLNMSDYIDVTEKTLNISNAKWDIFLTVLLAFDLAKKLKNWEERHWKCICCTDWSFRLSHADTVSTTCSSHLLISTTTTPLIYAVFSACASCQMTVFFN